MSYPVVPGHDSAEVGSSAASRNGHSVSRQHGNEPGGEPQACGHLTLVLLVAVELAAFFAMIYWAKFSTAEALQATICVTAIGLAAYHGKPMFLAVGRRLFNNGS
jgi:hypothetical protein